VIARALDEEHSQRSHREAEVVTSPQLAEMAGVAGGEDVGARFTCRRSTWASSAWTSDSAQAVCPPTRRRRRRRQGRRPRL